MNVLILGFLDARKNGCKWGNRKHKQKGMQPATLFSPAPLLLGLHPVQQVPVGESTMKAKRCLGVLLPFLSLVSSIIWNRT